MCPQMRSRDSIDKKGKRRIIKQKKQQAGVDEAGDLATGRLTSRTGAHRGQWVSDSTTLPEFRGEQTMKSTAVASIRSIEKKQEWH